MQGGSSSSACAYKKGLWTVEEDRILLDYIKIHGKGKWNRVAKLTALKRCGKSCRLRWMNYLSPNIKRGNFSEEEDDLIIRLHKLLGNRWSLIAGRVPGRTDNQVKNYWNTHLSRRLGVKKENYKVTTSSTTFSGELLRNNSDNPSSSNYISNPNNNNNGGTGRNAAEDRSKELVELAINQEVKMADLDDNSFLFLNDNYPDLYNPNLLEM
ncbi:hypothetical protein JCGZ_11479 [Jatropha curcas]|uniref:MYB family protein n=1 Tax=Jatropha curcas TaxID=180498 RepID=A0A067K7V1_JATCU|nr:transcription factor WER [Jatropha curcas]AIT52272.1 MYB family protein [Jatropha curcas]KDP31103.1 hypothetical protein JCGZ_11479 [Jatropha curcas]